MDGNDAGSGRDGPVGDRTGSEAEGLDLTGAPGWVTPVDSKRIRSRLEVLAPGASVGRHSTTMREEVVVFLEGSGTLELGDRRLPLKAPSARYIGEGVPHDIINDGDGELRYVYVVAFHDEPERCRGGHGRRD